MNEKQEIEIFIVMDEDGDYAVGVSEEEALDLFRENVGESAFMRRIVRLPVRMAPPDIEEGPTVDIPDTAGSTTQVEVEAAV